ncbi:pseudouridine synthase [Dichotomopilus funicola]|uniref:Pseudouridine synthase n=1 Tax=Dichotomopilus funicola TaxID=1934379 RepID=A0AAN6V177_9PEZI|nr:pseudouridine synthase [Dichotomopilus funicola]
MADPNYEDWSRDQLLERVRELEGQIKSQTSKPEPPPPATTSTSTPAPTPTPTTTTTSTPPPPPPPKATKPKSSKNKLPKAPHNLPANKAKNAKPSKLDPSKYTTRPIALKIAYLGRRYGGFEYQPSSSVATAATSSTTSTTTTTATPATIEEALWRALVRSCLIWPEDPARVDFTPWEYSKCGRTDKGVSAFGQVVGITVRSNRPLPRQEKQPESTEGGEKVEGDGDVKMTEPGDQNDSEEKPTAKPPWDPIADEINYPRVLNKLLPPDIRVLAWAPTLPANFSARFSCWERQYRYFFTQPAFPPLPAFMEGDSHNTENKSGWLDINAMRHAAKMFEGVHDFRNFCKLDGAKQVASYKRRVFEADVVEVEDTGSALPYLGQPEFQPPGTDSKGVHPKVYYLHVRGSAFLWHQIRHMVAILFLIGQGLEPPSLVADLLDIDKTPRKPNYAMADEVPLVLWDCIFPRAAQTTESQEDDQKKAVDMQGTDMHDPNATVDTDLQDALDWVWLGEDTPAFLHGGGGSGLVDSLWTTWREHKMDEVLANRLLDTVSRRADLRRQLDKAGTGTGDAKGGQMVFEGGDGARAAGVYVPVMKKQLLATPQEVDDRWAQSKGFESAEAMRGTENWRGVIRASKQASK